MIKKIIIGSLFIALLSLGIFYAIDYKLATDTKLSELTNTIAVKDETINEHVASLEELCALKLTVETERDNALVTLATRTDERDAEIALKNVALEEKALLFTTLETRTQERDAEIALKNQALAEKATAQAEVTRLNEVITSINEEIAEVESELADELLANSQNQELISSLQADIVALNNLKAGLESDVTGLNNQISILNGQITAHENTITQKNNEISNLEVQVSNFEGQIASYETIIGEKNAEISTLNGQIDTLDLQVSNLQAQVLDLQNQLENQEDETDYTTMQELFNIMLTVPKIDVDINEFQMSVDYTYFTYYSSYSQVMNTEYVYGGSLLAEIYYISSDFEIFGTSTYSMNDGFNCDDSGSSTDFLAVDYLSFNGYIVVVYKDSSPDRTIYCYSQFNMNILNDYAMIDKGFDMLQLSFGQGDYIKIQVIGENIDYSIQIENEGDMYLTPDVLGLDTYNVFDFENVTFKVQYFYENGIACTNLYEV